MPVEGIRCPGCGEPGVQEYKTNTFICPSCDHIFKYIDPTRTSVEVDVAPQFCEEGCGNPIKYKCALCGKMVCEGHGEKAKVLLVRRVFADGYGGGRDLVKTTVPELQQAWCLTCSQAMATVDTVRYTALALQDSVFGVRQDAVRALQRIGDPSAVPYLIQALEHSNLGARELGVFGDLSAVPALIKAVSRYDGNAEASEALGKIGDPSAVPALIDTLGARRWEARLRAAEALGKFGDPSAVPALVQVFGSAEEGHYHGSGTVRGAAVTALMKIGTPAVPALVEVLKNSDHYVRDCAAEALGEIGDTSAVPYLIDAMKQYQMNYYVEGALRKIGDPKGMAALSKAEKMWAKRKQFKG